MEVSGAPVCLSRAQSSAFGQTVTLTATVVASGSGTPTGNVTFMDGTATLGTGALNASGQTTFAMSGLAVGPHSITASYDGAAGFNGSASPVFTQTVNPASTSTALASTVNPSVFGQALTLTAIVNVVAPEIGRASCRERVYVLV